MVGSNAPSTHDIGSDDAVVETVRHALGTTRPVRLLNWYIRRGSYVVALVETGHERMVVKLAEAGGERPNRHFETMAMLGRLVRQRTSVPTYDVLAVDVTTQHWPWQYLIVSHLPGATWQALYPTMDDLQRGIAQRQLGRAAAQLHTLRFETFGHFGPDATVDDGYTTILPALENRLRLRINNPRSQSVFLEVLEQHARWFSTRLRPTLCHEDLNPYNVLFEIHHGQPVLTGIIDFESAWASTGESDLARLELWRVTRGSAVREGYADMATLADEYPRRKPVLQLLWCLEYSEFRTSALHQADIDRLCQELSVAPLQFR
jgi:Ser/Thr protein kinase RdoA (MazF antagonist)